MCSDAAQDVIGLVVHITPSDTNLPRTAVVDNSAVADSLFKSTMHLTPEDTIFNWLKTSGDNVALLKMINVSGIVTTGAPDEHNRPIITNFTLPQTPADN